MRKIIIVSLSLLFLFTGCGRKQEEKSITGRAAEKALEKMIEKESGGKAKVDISGESLSIKTEDGEVNISGGDNVKIPADFPSDVYQYEGGKIMTVMQMQGNTSVSYGCAEKPSKVTETYKSKMGQNGWTVLQTMDMGEQQMVTFSKGERVATIIVGKSDEETFISLTLATQ